MITVRQLLDKMENIDTRMLDSEIHDINGNAADLIITVNEPNIAPHSITHLPRIGRSVYFDLTK